MHNFAFESHINLHLEINVGSECGVVLIRYLEVIHMKLRLLVKRRLACHK